MRITKQIQHSSEVWRLKQKECKYSITWQKDLHFPSYVTECMKCSLRMNEKLEIALYNEGNLLNTHNRNTLYTHAVIYYKDFEKPRKQ